jgi:hypothetical protein
MAALNDGRYVGVPWNDKFEKELIRLGDYTDKFSGENLLHEIHREEIQSKWINLYLHRLIRTRLAIAILLQLITLGFLAHLTM